MTMYPASFFCILLLGLAIALAHEECSATHEKSRTREESDKTRRTRIRNCDQLTCDKEEICFETEKGPQCVINAFLSCMDHATCPKGTRCVEVHVPSRDLFAGQCLAPEMADIYPTYKQYTCSSGFEVCKPGTVCVETFQEGNFLTVVCAPTGCSDENPCPGFLLCVETPQHLQDSFQSVCVAPTNFEFGSDSCNTFDKVCTNGFACHDFTFQGQHIGTGCGPSGTAFTASSCSELDCPTLLECYQLVIDGRGSLAECIYQHTVDMDHMVANDYSVDMVANEIKSLLEKMPDAT